MGIRTVVGFMIGFPGDTEQSIGQVLRYAKRLNPTFANFNVVTPYPGTVFFAENRHRIVETDYSRYSSYDPVFKYDNLTAWELTRLNGRCFNHYYFRWEYLRGNAHLLWPALQRFGWVRSWFSAAGGRTAHAVVPQWPSGPKSLKHKGIRAHTPRRLYKNSVY